MQRWRSDWALVTGASSGIGREFAVQLARSGMNVALVARRGDLLEGLSQELIGAFGARTLVLPSDLTQPASATDLRARIEGAGIRIRLLVNNAAEGRWGRFERVSSADYMSMLHLDTGAPVAMCLEFLPHLRSFPRSAVINVSSQAALQPVPFMAVYAACKAFIQSFSLALYEEWKGYGVHVQTLIPGPSATEFDAKAGAYQSSIDKRALPSEAVLAALMHLQEDRPLIASAKGIMKQRVANALLPSRIMLGGVAKMFRPPDEK